MFRVRPTTMPTTASPKQESLSVVYDQSRELVVGSGVGSSLRLNTPMTLRSEDISLEVVTSLVREIEKRDANSITITNNINWYVARLREYYPNIIVM